MLFINIYKYKNIIKYYNQFLKKKKFIKLYLAKLKKNSKNKKYI